jgi:hypothetical protein
MVADKETAGIDLLDSLDRIKEEVEAKYGKEEPSQYVTPLSRFEERFQALRADLEQVLNTPVGED